MENNLPTATESVSAPGWSELALAQIRLERSPHGGFGLKNGKYWVKESTLQFAWRLFWRSARGLDPHGVYDAQGLACTEDWSHRPRGERIAIGRCFKYFALHGVLPIRLVNPDKKCNFKYRLNDNLDLAPSTY